MSAHTTLSYQANGFAAPTLQLYNSVSLIIIISADTTCLLTKDFLTKTLTLLSLFCSYITAFFLPQCLLAQQFLTTFCHQGTDFAAPVLQLYNSASGVITDPAELPILTRTWPVNLYPYMTVLPVTGSLLVIAGAQTDIYNGEGNPGAFTGIDARYPAIPNLPVPVSYPQTATFALLTLEPANDYVAEVKMQLPDSLQTFAAC